MLYPEDGAHEGEIKVTPAMIDAGVTVLALCESGDSWWSTAEAVYQAMESVRRASQIPLSPKLLPPPVSLTIQNGSDAIGPK